MDSISAFSSAENQKQVQNTNITDLNISESSNTNTSEFPAQPRRQAQFASCQAPTAPTVIRVPHHPQVNHQPNQPTTPQKQFMGEMFDRMTFQPGAWHRSHFSRPIWTKPCRLHPCSWLENLQATEPNSCNCAPRLHCVPCRFHDVSRQNTESYIRPVAVAPRHPHLQPLQTWPGPPRRASQLRRRKEFLTQ